MCSSDNMWEIDQEKFRMISAVWPGSLAGCQKDGSHPDFSVCLLSGLENILLPFWASVSLLENGDGSIHARLHSKIFTDVQVLSSLQNGFVFTCSSTYDGVMS